MGNSAQSKFNVPEQVDFGWDNTEGGEDQIRKYRIAKVTRALQLLRHQLRNANSEKDVERIERDIEQGKRILTHYLGVPLSEVEEDIDYYESAKDHLGFRQKRLRISDSPDLAYYDKEEKMTPTPLPNWRSLDEINRHGLEMDRAETKARWIGGRKRIVRRKSLTRNSSWYFA